MTAQHSGVHDTGRGAQGHQVPFSCKASDVTEQYRRKLREPVQGQRATLPVVVDFVGGETPGHRSIRMRRTVVVRHYGARAVALRTTKQSWLLGSRKYEPGPTNANT